MNKELLQEEKENAEEMMFVIELGKRIYALRQERGYTRKKLSELANVSEQYLYEIERAMKVPSVKKVAQIAKALEVECGCIMNGIL